MALSPGAGQGGRTRSSLKPIAIHSSFRLRAWRFLDVSELSTFHPVFCVQSHRLLLRLRKAKGLLCLCWVIHVPLRNSHRTALLFSLPKAPAPLKHHWWMCSMLSLRSDKAAWFKRGDRASQAKPGRLVSQEKPVWFLWPANPFRPCGFPPCVR